jgi:uncharacterized membrane protein YdcZ (DUF606 family)
MGTLFFIFVALIVIGFGLAAFNMYKSVNQPYTMEGMLGTHFIAMGIMGIGSLGSVITGIIWIVEKFS